MGDKIVKSKNLCCQPVVFPSLSLLRKYGIYVIHYLDRCIVYYLLTCLSSIIIRAYASLGSLSNPSFKSSSIGIIPSNPNVSVLHPSTKLGGTFKSAHSFPFRPISVILVFICESRFDSLSYSSCHSNWSIHLKHFEIHKVFFRT